MKNGQILAAAISGMAIEHSKKRLGANCRHGPFLASQFDTCTQRRQFSQVVTNFQKRAFGSRRVFESSAFALGKTLTRIRAVAKYPQQALDDD